MALPPKNLMLWFLGALVFGAFFTFVPVGSYRLNPVAFVTSLLFIGYWNYAAIQDFKGNVPPPTKRQSGLSRLIHLIALFVCTPLSQITDGTNYFRVLGASWFVVHWIGYFVLILGLAWAIWARRTLGRQWRGHVEVRSDHELITAGYVLYLCDMLRLVTHLIRPYQITRHPIYTGGLMMALGGVISGGGSPLSWIGFIAVLASILHKISLEEELMQQHFKKYAQYKMTVPKLVPGIHFI